MLRKFLTLFHTFPHMLRKFLTLFHTFPHMLRKFAHCSACIHTGNTLRIPTYGLLFRMNPTLYGI
jgi:hypothetical protein